MYSGYSSRRPDRKPYRRSYARDREPHPSYQDMTATGYSSHRPRYRQRYDEMDHREHDFAAHRSRQEPGPSFRNGRRYQWHRGEPRYSEKVQSPSDKENDTAYVPNIIRIGQIRCLAPGHRCKYYHQIGYCLKGDDCPFEHGSECLVLKDYAELERFCQYYIYTPERDFYHPHETKERKSYNVDIVEQKESDYDEILDIDNDEEVTFCMSEQRQHLLEKYRETILSVEEKFSKEEDLLYCKSVYGKLKDVVNRLENAADMSTLSAVFEQCEAVDEYLDSCSGEK